MKSTQTKLASSYPSYMHCTRHHSFFSFFNYSKTKKNISTCKPFIIKIAENKTTIQNAFKITLMAATKHLFLKKSNFIGKR